MRQHLIMTEHNLESCIVRDKTMLRGWGHSMEPESQDCDRKKGG